VLLSHILCAFTLLPPYSHGPRHAQRIDLFGVTLSCVSPVTSRKPTGFPVSSPVCITTHLPPNLNLNGLERGGAFKVFGTASAQADFADTLDRFRGANTHLKTFLIGPQLRFQAPISPSRISFLIGGAHESPIPPMAP